MPSLSALQEDAPRRGRLVINADDWGRDANTTDRTLECYQRGAISSVSAMVFMEDSERAAALAREYQIDAGLHLNFTSPLTARDCPPRLAQHQQRISRCLLRFRFAQVVFHPTLVRSFEYVVAAQVDEFRRLYGTAPERIDGHHHMHLCANVVLSGLLPKGIVVRRNFSFRPGEKNLANRFYRWEVDRLLARRHPLADFFFSLDPLEPPSRLERIFSLSSSFTVEIETHCTKLPEYRFLIDGELFRVLNRCQLAASCDIPIVKPDPETLGGQRL